MADNTSDVVDAIVKYTAKELISRVEAKIDALFSIISDKVNQSDHAALTSRVEKLEKKEEADKAVKLDRKERLIIWAVGIAVLIGNGFTIAKSAGAF